MEEYKPDPLEGPGAFPWAWCHAAFLCCMLSWRGAGSPCCSTAALGENISSLARAFGSSLLLRDARHVSGTFQTRFIPQQKWPDLPLQHQQPTQNTQGNGLAACQGRAPSPVTDRQTDLRRQRAHTALAFLCRAPPQPACRSPPVWSRPVSALPWLRELRWECGDRPGTSARAAGTARHRGLC